MLASFGASVIVAWLLYRTVEARPASWRALLALWGGLLLCGTVAAWCARAMRVRPAAGRRS